MSASNQFRIKSRYCAICLSSLPCTGPRKGRSAKEILFSIERNLLDFSRGANEAFAVERIPIGSHLGAVRILNHNAVNR